MRIMSIPTLVLSGGTAGILEKNFRTPFYGWVQLSKGDSLPFTNKSPGVTGTHLIYLGRMKGQYILLYFYKPFRTLILSRNFAQFSLKAVYVPMAEENLKLMVFRLSKNVFAT